VKLPAPLLPASVVRRVNRFTVEVALDGRLALAHLANSGRLGELLTPGATCYLAAAASAKRRTAYDLVLVRYGATLVSVDARKPNPLFEEALAERRLTAFAAYETWRREVLYNGCRIDFRLEAGGRPPCLVETKSCTLVVGGAGYFPDAPTGRGERHVRALIAARGEGFDAAVVWVVQRFDARALRPWEKADPALVRALREAREAGVRLLAYRCEVSLAETRIGDEIPVELD
jgi:sugar fermentation stimulation protein A